MLLLNGGKKMSDSDSGTDGEDDTTLNHSGADGEITTELGAEMDDLLDGGDL